MTPDPLPVALPELPEPAAHMYPSDLERFQSKETFAQAFSVAVGNPDERSVPLFTLSDMVAHAEAALRAQAEEVRGLLATITTARAALRDMQHAAAAKPSCQFGSVSRCKCKRCADALAQAAIGQIDAHLAASRA